MKAIKGSYRVPKYQIFGLVFHIFIRKCTLAYIILIFNINIEIAMDCTLNFPQK